MQTKTKTIECLEVTIIIPCFNEEEVITATYDRVKKSLKDIGATRHEIIFINDGSEDRTLEILRGMAQIDKNVHVLSFSRNFGHQAAVSAGIENCQGDIAIIIDADLQDPPELFGEMIRIHLDQDADIVYGLRRKRKGKSIFKKLSAYFYYRILGFLSDDHKLPKDTGDFRLIDRRIIETFKNIPEKKEYLRGLIHWMGFKQVALPYQRDERLAGMTKYQLRKMLKFASKGIMYFSVKPLHIATIIGLCSITVGLLCAIYVLFADYSNTVSIIPGWAYIIITIIFFGGVQLLCLGILGAYLSVVLNEVKRRPQYIIQENINGPAGKSGIKAD